MPIHEGYRNRLYPVLPDIVEQFGTPFHIYDEIGIRETGKNLKTTFNRVNGFQEYFAVKALPNPRILDIIHDMGFGFDCSSIAELYLSRQAGAGPDDLMFTSNNTSLAEFQAALADNGSIINLDDITLISKVPQIPDLICFRYNPGANRAGNSIIGKPEEAKFGVAHNQLIDAYRVVIERGAKRFGLHTMLASNELDYRYMVQTTAMLLQIVEWISSELSIQFEFINIGGGLGIPYRPGQTPFDLKTMGCEVTALFDQFHQTHGYAPHLYMESGRYITGPHGVLVVKVINRKDIYRTYIGVDASMSALMRPGIYNAYHHIEVLGKKADAKTTLMDVVGSLCENNDKFAVQRPLPHITDNDILIIHDTGAHGHAMGFNYNAKLRPQELLFRSDGRVERIRRAETVEDYFATLNFEQHIITPKTRYTN